MKDPAMSNSGSESIDALLRDSDVDEVMRASFYGSETPRPTVAATKPLKAPRATKPKPDHYEVICISMYKEDLERLDAKVLELKQNGHRKMTRSGLIRFALDQVDSRKMPRAY